MCDGALVLLVLCVLVRCRVDSTEEKYEELKKKLAELEEAAVETGGVKEKVADLHKRFQEVTGWKAGKVRVYTLSFVHQFH